MDKVWDGLARLGTYFGMWLKPVTLLLAAAAVFGAGTWVAAGISLLAVIILRKSSKAWLEYRGLEKEIPYLIHAEDERPREIVYGGDLTYEIPRPQGALRRYDEGLATVRIKAELTTDDRMNPVELAERAENLRRLLEFDLNYGAKLEEAWMSVRIVSVRDGSLEAVYNVVVSSWTSAAAILIAYPKAKEGYEKLVRDLGRQWSRYVKKLGPAFSLSPPQVVTLRLETEEEIRERLNKS